VIRLDGREGRWIGLGGGNMERGLGEVDMIPKQKVYRTPLQVLENGNTKL
jgi:hypothetical protein